MGLGGLGLAIGGYVLVNHCLFNVEGGHRAVLYSRLTGLSPVVRGEGTHFKIPWLQRPYIYNVRSTPRNIKSLTGSRGEFLVLDSVSVRSFSVSTDVLASNSRFGSMAFANSTSLATAHGWRYRIQTF